MAKGNGAPKQLMPIIAVKSVEDARNFYIEKLGFDHVMGILGSDGHLDFCTVVLSGARIMFARGSQSEPDTVARKQAVQIYLEVDDVRSYHDRINMNVSVTDPLTLQWWGDLTFKVMDPNGYECWFYETQGEPKPPQGAKIV